MEIYETVKVLRLSDNAECVIAVHELEKNPDLYKKLRKSAPAPVDVGAGNKKKAGKKGGK